MQEIPDHRGGTGQMKVIETYDQLLDWAKRCNDQHTMKQKCDLQDEFMRSEIGILKKLFIEATERKCYDHKTILWGIYKVLSDDVFFQYVGMWAKSKAEQILLEGEKDMSARWNLKWHDIDEANNRLNIKKQIFEDCKKPIFKRIKKMQVDIDGLKKVVFKLKTELDLSKQVAKANYCRAEKNEEDAEEYRKLMAIISRRAA